MEIEAFNGYTSNYPIILNSSSDHGNIYCPQSNYNYQYSSDNLVWINSENFINQQSDLSNISSPTSFYFQNQTINNSTNSDDLQQQPQHQVLIIENCAKSKRGRKKGSGKKSEKVKIKTSRRSSKRSDSSPPSPTVIKKRRLAANARERRRMNGLNSAFDR